MSGLWPFSTLSATVEIMAKRESGTGNSLDDIAERLRLAREALGISQAEMGRRAGVTYQAWNNWERGAKRISVDQAGRLRRATGISLDWIYWGDMRGLPHELAVKIQGQLTAGEKKSRRA